MTGRQKVRARKVRQRLEKGREAFMLLNHGSPPAQAEVRRWLKTIRKPELWGFRLTKDEQVHHDTHHGDIT